MSGLFILRVDPLEPLTVLLGDLKAIREIRIEVMLSIESGERERTTLINGRTPVRTVKQEIAVLGFAVYSAIQGQSRGYSQLDGFWIEPLAGTHTKIRSDGAVSLSAGAEERTKARCWIYRQGSR